MRTKTLLSWVLTTLMLTSVGANAIIDTKKQAPDFTLKSNKDANLRLSELRGEVVMINFWASWCGPCRKEMPLLNEMYQRYQDLGFTILGVNVEEDATAANKIIKDLGVSFPILYDNASKVSKQYDVDSMPSTVLVDRDGNVRYVHRGYKPGDESRYIEYVKSLVRE